MTNRALDLADKSLKRTRAYLDVKRVVDSQVDIQQLLQTLMSEQRLWLFRQEKSRFPSKDKSVEVQSP
jgi:hypothetical protein